MAGILPESGFLGDRLEWVVIGMGINVNQLFDSDDPLAVTATSLLSATGQAVDRARLLARILSRINHWNARLEHEHLLNAWRKRCITLEQRVRAETPDGFIEGLALDIHTKGELIIRDDAGTLHFLTLSETTLLPQDKLNPVRDHHQ